MVRGIAALTRRALPCLLIAGFLAVVPVRSDAADSELPTPPAAHDAWSCQGRTIGAAIGAALGAMIGRNIAESERRGIGTSVGAGIGAAIGAMIGRELDRRSPACAPPADGDVGTGRQGPSGGTST